MSHLHGLHWTHRSCLIGLGPKVTRYPPPLSPVKRGNFRGNSLPWFQRRLRSMRRPGARAVRESEGCKCARGPAESAVSPPCRLQAGAKILEQLEASVRGSEWVRADERPAAGAGANSSCWLTDAAFQHTALDRSWHTDLDPAAPSSHPSKKCTFILSQSNAIIFTKTCKDCFDGENYSQEANLQEEGESLTDEGEREATLCRERRRLTVWEEGFTCTGTESKWQKAPDHVGSEPRFTLSPLVTPGGESSSWLWSWNRLVNGSRAKWWTGWKVNCVCVCAHRTSSVRGDRLCCLLGQGVSWGTSCCISQMVLNPL